MAAELIDGKKLAAETRAQIAAGVAALKSEKGVTPGLAVILVGDNPASVSYVTAKEKACVEAGMHSREIRLPASVAEADLLAEIARLNADPAIHGILVQLPLPKGFDEKKVIDAIAPEKDVDGFTPENVGKMLIGEECFLPCTPHGIIKLIEVTGMKLAGKHAVVIGRSLVVGKPAAMMLLKKNATVTVCHTRTKDLAERAREADILIAAAGRAGIVGEGCFREGQIVLDVGINVNEEGKLCGDVDFAAAEPVAEAITPVPGGVGAVTTSVLARHVVEAAENA